MPSALYAISYRATGSLVALTSFEKQDLPDRPAWQRLLTTLVGPAIPISMSTSGAPIAIAANELACDLVTSPSRQDLEAALAEPYRFRVALEGDAVPELGDGKDKVLRKANRHIVTSVVLLAGHPAQVKITLANPPPDGVSARLVFEGRESADLPSRAGAASSDVIFMLPSDVAVTAGTHYGLVFLLEGAPIEARFVAAKAGSSPLLVSPEPVPRAAP